MAGLGGAWDYGELDAFLAAPKAFAPGTKMTFKGIADPADRAADHAARPAHGQQNWGGVQIVVGDLKLNPASPLPLR